jgi:hypothetical protein
MGGQRKLPEQKVERITIDVDEKIYPLGYRHLDICSSLRFLATGIFPEAKFHT